MKMLIPLFFLFMEVMLGVEIEAPQEGQTAKHELELLGNSICTIEFFEKTLLLYSGNRG